MTEEELTLQSKEICLSWFYRGKNVFINPAHTQLVAKRSNYPRYQHIPCFYAAGLSPAVHGTWLANFISAWFDWSIMTCISQPAVSRDSHKIVSRAFQRTYAFIHSFRYLLLTMGLCMIFPWTIACGTIFFLFFSIKKTLRKKKSGPGCREHFLYFFSRGSSVRFFFPAIFAVRKRW